jgi:TP901 family phage tail tape measure protein
VATVANLYIRIAASATEFEKTLKGVEAQFKRTGAKLQSSGANLSKAFTLPLLALGAASAKAAIDFESSFAGVRKTVNATEAEFAKMAQGMRDMAKEMPVSVNELNKIGEAAGQLGIGKGDILEFTKVMAMLGATTNLTSDQAATSIAQIQNIFNASGKDTSQFASALVALGNAGASTEAQIVDFASRIAGAGNQAHMSQAQVLGWGAALANVGLNAELGGTAISTFINKMGVAVDMGGKKLQKFAEIASLSGKGQLTGAGFKDLFKSDASEALNRVVEGMRNAGLKGQNLTMVLAELGYKGSNVRDVMLRLAGSGDKVRDTLELSRSAWLDNSALTDEYKKRAETTASQLQILWNKINDVAITLGTALLPTLKLVVFAMDPLIKMAAGLVERFGALPGPVQAVAIGIAALVAAAGPAVYVAGALVSAFGSVAGLMAGTVLSGFLGLAAPIAALITLVGALAFGMNKLAGAGTNVVDAFQQNGWAGVLGELGRNVNNDDLSFFKSGRVDQARMGKGKGDINLPGSNGDIDLDAEVKRATIQGSAASVAAADVSNAAQRAAKAHSEAIKTMAEGLSGATAVKGLTDLVQAWKSLPPSIQQSKPVLDKVLEGYMRLSGDLTNVPAALKPVVTQLNGMALAAGEFADKVTDGLTSLDGIAKEVKDSGLDAFMDVLALENPGSAGVNAASIGSIIGAMPDIGKPEKTDYFSQAFDDSAKALAESVESAFKYFAGALSPALSGLLGGVLNIFQKAIGEGGFLSGLAGKFGKQIGGMIDAGLAGFGGGFAFGEELGRGKGALAGAGSGALAGFAAGGPIGAAIGGLAGLFGGLFGGGKKKKEERAKMSEAKGQLLEQFGGMEELTAAATRAGVSVTTLFATDDAKLFQQELQKVTGAIEVMQERIATTVGEIDKVMAEGGLIGKELWQSILTDGDAEEIKAKMAEVFDASVQRSAEGFSKIAMNFELLKRPLNEIGVLADAAFAGLLAGGASIPEAIAQMGDGLAHIQELMAKSGEGATGPLAQILNYQAISEAHAGLFELLSGVDDMIVGLGNSGMLTQERFSALGMTITQAFGQLTAQGVAGTTAMEMMQPQLQKLWEAQQTFGLKTDAATQALIDQAVTQGLVGQNMKDVNSQILDVLTAIAKVLGAELPAAMNALGPIAAQAGQAIKTEFGDIRVGVGVDWNIGKMPQPDGPTGGTGSKSPTSSGYVDDEYWQRNPVRAMAAGGIVTRPTRALIGEAGPEAVIPLDEWREQANINVTVNGTADRDFARVLARQISLGGDVKTAWRGAIT